MEIRDGVPIDPSQYETIPANYLVPVEYYTGTSEFKTDWEFAISQTLSDKITLRTGKTVGKLRLLDTLESHDSIETVQRVLHYISLNGTIPFILYTKLCGVYNKQLYKIYIRNGSIRKYKLEKTTDRSRILNNVKADIWLNGPIISFLRDGTVIRIVGWRESLTKSESSYWICHFQEKNQIRLGKVRMRTRVLGIEYALTADPDVHPSLHSGDFSPIIEKIEDKCIIL